MAEGRTDKMLVLSAAKRTATLLILVWLSTAAAASASPFPRYAHHRSDADACSSQMLTIVNDARAAGSVIWGIERAAEIQARQLRAWWGTPCVRFGPGGWKITLYDSSPTLPNVPWGDHGSCWPGATYAAPANCSGPPWAIVYTAGDLAGNSEVFFHELDEMLVDPYDTRFLDGRLVEVCDPAENVNGDEYWVDGFWAADFVYPAWFTGRAAKRYDAMGLIGAAGQRPG